MPRKPLSSRTRNSMILGAATLTLAGLGAQVLWDDAPHTRPDALAVTAAPTRPSPTKDPLTPTAPNPTHVRDQSTAAPGDAHQALTAWRSGNTTGTSTSGAAGTITEVLRIPALGSNWAEPVYEGVTPTQLGTGVGHFPGTEQPGQIGNFAIAGHRSGVADPAFRNIDAIHRGDVIDVTTADRVTYTYTVTTVETVAPTDVDVIAQVPGHPNQTPAQPLLTLITCWPADGHSKRVVVIAALTAQAGGA